MLFLRIVALLPAMLGAAIPVRAEPRFSFETTPCCLPKDIRPLAYRLDLKPDLEKLASADGKEDVEFSGEEEVKIEVLKPTDTIVLNAVGLSFKGVTLDNTEVTNRAVDEQKQTVTFRLAHKLTSGRHKLTIVYSGKIVPQPHGIYYADYDSPFGKSRMLITQFEATDARRMYPSWDEPIFKATVALSAELPSGFRAISNMPIVHEEPVGPSKKKVTFAPTPKMSSYLAVLVAGAVESVGQTIAGVGVKVDSPGGREEHGRYALDLVANVLPYYNEYFGVKYPLPKLDLIAIPNFAASAMENWGGITYIDSSLLFDPKDSTQTTKGAIFGVVAHEMAHQWTGNLVTMAWWNNLWLNEGFASRMQKKATDRFNPSWKIWLRAHGDKERAMAMDALRTAHPIQQEIINQSQIDSALDPINYQKGEAVIRMIEAYVGDDIFRDGMRTYIKAHAYSNSTTADLWAALEKASRKPVGRIAAGFTEYPGIPLIHLATSCTGGKTVATLHQDRFSIHNRYAEARVWQVPVAIGRLGDPNSH
jgi:aminopeptidase N